MAAGIGDVVTILGDGDDYYVIVARRPRGAGYSVMCRKVGTDYYSGWKDAKDCAVVPLDEMKERKEKLQLQLEELERLTT